MRDSRVSMDALLDKLVECMEVSVRLESEKQLLIEQIMDQAQEIGALRETIAQLRGTR